MSQKGIVTAAAWLEIVVGATVLATPDAVCKLLFATGTEGVGMPLARFAGLALVGLGIACLPATNAGSNRRATLGLLAFNAGVAILLSWVGVATEFRGVLLWPGAILHAVIAVVLGTRFLSPGAAA